MTCRPKFVTPPPMPMTFRLSLFLGSMKLPAMNAYARSHPTRAAATPWGFATRRFALALTICSVLAGCSEPAAQNGNRSLPGGAGGGPVGVVTAPENTQTLGIDIEAVGSAVAN